jgi:hypothetical protein
MTKPVSTDTGGSFEPAQHIFFRIEPSKKGARVRAPAHARDKKSDSAVAQKTGRSLFSWSLLRKAKQYTESATLVST